MSTVYTINRGINRPIEFKGIQAQYIIYLVLGIVLLLLLFAILHLAHVNLYICLGVILPAGGALIVAIRRLSSRFGQHGLTKHAAALRLPASVQSRSRRPFTQLNATKQ
jgi:hypothetical protein